MAHKARQQEKALARVDPRPATGSLARVNQDPVGIGPDRSITIDMAKLPAPQQAYDADYAWIEHRPGDVRLFFAKARRGGRREQLRTCLELRYPPESLVGHFWRNSRDFHSQMKQFASAWPTDQDRNSVTPADMMSDKDHSEWTNFESMSHAGTEAVIDFYSLPPAGLARFALGAGSAGLTITPVVRVQLSIFELVRLLDSMESVVQEIERYLPAGLPKFEQTERQS
jgi:hypothetical protein